MKTKILLSFLILGIIISAFGQNLELGFTALDSTTNVQLDSIKIMNRTQSVDTVLYWPDTVLILYHVGIIDNLDKNTNFHIQQNYPNPVVDLTTININMPEKSDVNLTITDILGRQVINIKRQLEKGSHEFSFKPGNAEIYLFSVTIKNTTQSIKILNASQGTDKHCSLNYIGNTSTRLQTKSTISQAFSFTLGDILLYIGYFDTLQSGIQDSPEISEDYSFQFASNIPCPGMPTIDYDGQIYNTVQIYSQCWFKENLNVGTKINSNINPTDNDTIEKYCFGNNAYYCNGWGGLYFWNELMNYTYETGGQGICPDGWHIPDDLDWQILEGLADSEYNIEDPEWRNSDWRGSDAGGNLKQTGTISWTPPNTGATDALGLTVLPAGYFVQNDFWGLGYKGIYWSSDSDYKYYRHMDWNQKMIKKGNGGDGLAISVRCVKDN